MVCIGNGAVEEIVCAKRSANLFGILIHSIGITTSLFWR